MSNLYGHLIMNFIFTHPVVLLPYFAVISKYIIKCAQGNASSQPSVSSKAVTIFVIEVEPQPRVMGIQTRTRNK